MLVNKVEVDEMIRAEKDRIEFENAAARRGREHDFRKAEDRETAMEMVKAARRRPPIAPAFAFGIGADAVAKGAPALSRENQKHLDDAAATIAMAHSLPFASEAEFQHWRAAAEHLASAGANVAAMHQGTVDSSRPRASGHVALATHAQRLIRRVRDGGGLGTETTAHLDQALAHLRGAGGEEERQGTAFEPAKSAGGGFEDTYPRLRKSAGVDESFPPYFLRGLL